MTGSPSGSRIAIVDGVRTPFAKRGTAFARLTALDLSMLACREVLERTGFPARELGQAVVGQVIPSVRWTNIARETVLGLAWPRSLEAYTVSRACATGYQSVVSVAQAIRAGSIDAGLAAGADSASDVPLAVSEPMRRALLSKNPVRGLAGLKLADWKPEAPAIAEPSTGETMGQAAERMAKENGIPRTAQDEFAHQSHVRAAAAWNDGRLAADVVPVHLPGFQETLERDNLVRFDSDLSKYASLPPVFDRKHGTVTAGNSSPLTDGAAAALVMSEAKARALGLPVLGFIRSHAFVAVDPRGQLLIGPAIAIPRALSLAGLTLKDIALIDLHEAFSSAVLSVTRALASREFAKRELGRDEAVGEIDPERLNVTGGSIALGHPFAATGIRQIVQTLRELRRRGGGLGLCSACAAGGLGAAMVLEAA